VAIPGRERCLEALVEQLGPTRVGADLGLRSLSSLADLRSSLPVLDADDHEREIETRLGFGLADGEQQRDELERGEVERAAVVDVWRARLPDRPSPRVALLWGRAVDPWVDRIVADDVTAWASEVRRFDRVDDPQVVLEQLQRFEPEVIVAPSVGAIGWLESEFRRPLERALPRFSLALATYDYDIRVRSRRPVSSAGWVHRAGRLGLPATRLPARAVTLADASTIIELLAYTNPEDDARRVYAKQTILPEDANVGARYELVLSSPLGFVRLRSGEHVRVVGFEAPTPASPWPRPRVVRLAPAPMDVALEGCTIAGAWLTASIRQALLREDPALVAAEIGPDPRSIPMGADAMQSGSMRLPAAFKETELAWLAKTGAHRVAVSRPRGLLVKIELQGFVARETSPRLSDRIDDSLRRRSAAYDYLRARDELYPPRIVVLPTATRRSEQRRRIQELLGPVGGPDVRVVGL
jgi:hypothetical protein